MSTNLSVGRGIRSTRGTASMSSSTWLTRSPNVTSRITIRAPTVNRPVWKADEFAFFRRWSPRSGHSPRPVLRGTVNAVLAFGDGVHEPLGSGGAIGYLIGAENAGLTYMFHMMNEARIGVGAGAAALGYTSYLHALDYAKTRPQGRLPGAKNAGLPQVPIIRHPDVRRMLMASKAYVEGALGLVLLTARLFDGSVADTRSTTQSSSSTETIG
jgi:alkylation response protein AidB-like acyl-CoA dehydrogenase